MTLHMHVVLASSDFEATLKGNGSLTRRWRRSDRALHVLSEDKWNSR